MYIKVWWDLRKVVVEVGVELVEFFGFSIFVSKFGVYEA